MSNWPLMPFDSRKPNMARAYDFALGGKDNFAADRELTAQIQEIFPWALDLVRENREFLARAVEFVARQGVCQFIDVGSGLPASPNTHEVAGRVSPDARVAYVDNDPMVIAHARALLAGDGSIAAVPGDVRDPDAIMNSAGLTAVIDLDKPSCVILAMILDFVEPAQAGDIVAAFGRSMAPGSFLVISLGINNNTPDLAARVIAGYTAAAVHLHSREQIAGYFAGFEIVQPGLTEARYWRPQDAQADSGSRPADVIAGVGRKTA
jgi:SAM-dependent methyltransferase